MAFSKEVKVEILNKQRSLDASVSMLSGVILSAGSLVVSNRKISFEVNSESEELVSWVQRALIDKLGINENDIDINTNANQSKYILIVSSLAGSIILDRLGIVRTDRFSSLLVSHIPSQELISDQEGKLAFLAGAFVGSGSISTPRENSRGGYSLEWICQTDEKAQLIAEILAEWDIISRKIERNQTKVVYIKNSEDICQVLTLMGAIKSRLDIENRIVERDVRNNINRQSNCTSANLDKTLLASVKELKAINLIEETIGLTELNKNLYEVAILRLNNPQASLAELAELLDNKISRAALSLRLKNIIKIAENLGESNGE